MEKNAVVNMQNKDGETALICGKLGLNFFVWILFGINFSIMQKIWKNYKK